MPVPAYYTMSLVALLPLEKPGGLMNRFIELLAVLESDASNRSLEISGKRRDTLVEALRFAGAGSEHPEIAVTVPINFSAKRIADLITTFAESGCSTEWCFSMSTTPELKALPGLGPWYAKPELYSNPAFMLSIKVDKITEDDTGMRYIDLLGLARGLQLLATKSDGAYAHHFRDILQDNEDAATADIYMQMVCFGEEVFS